MKKSNVRISTKIEFFIKTTHCLCKIAIGDIMKKNVLIMVLLVIGGFLYLHGEGKSVEFKKLSEQEARVILHKGTEAPYTGKYDKFYEKGTYTCKQCGKALYNSSDKFSSGCGWPSFDDEIEGAVKRVPDADGRRVEIVCANCGAHLGHVFQGEQLTPKNTRHCVNSISMEFEPATHENSKKAYFAGGCFWGVEYHFEKVKGVISADSGYMGGHKDDPTYKEVCYTDTGHLEVVEVTYNPKIVDFETLAKLFFEIHDPTQTNGQGPDIGSQYLSAIFYNDDTEKETVEKLISILESKGLKVSTKLIDAKKHPFYEAEDYHQDYYKKHNKQPYCHSYTKRF
jgi:peptide methionine sulfoxide reductase msrA/msrB